MLIGIQPLFFNNGYLESSCIHLFLIGIFPQVMLPTSPPILGHLSENRPRRDALDKAEKSARTAIKLCTEHVPGLQLWSVLVVEGD